jgi:8-amino-7-oxononanoate synthase
MKHSGKPLMNSSPMYERITRQLDDRRNTNLFRCVVPYRSDSGRRIDCSTNSYLGLHANGTVKTDALQLARQTCTGNLASRLVATSSPLYETLEKEIADWKQTEAALVFNSGYAANVGIIQALCTRHTEVFCDRLNHASIYDGIALSGCRLSRYRHGDMSDLREKLKQSSAKEKLIITDTVFSMDGDCVPLTDIAELGKQSDALVMVDEAHATGLFGKTGSGRVEATGTEDGIAIRMGTLSKAIAGLGGYVAADKTLCDCFVNFSRSLIYSTALPHSVLAHDLAAIRYIRSNPDIGSALQRKSEVFRESLEALGYDTAPSTTQIIPCRTVDETEAIALVKYFDDNGVTVPAIRPPTVPAGTARLRFSCSLLHTDDDREKIIDLLKVWRNRNG